MIVLCIGAHPDDETYAGGTLAKLADEGHEVYLLVTTRGEGGSAGSPALCERHELGQVREQECRAAGAVLGARDVLFLPYEDPRPAEGKAQAVKASLEEFSAAIQAVVEQLRPDVVITHGSTGEYGHPQHIFTHQAALHALRGLWPWRPQDLLTWSAAHPNPEVPADINLEDPADMIVNIRPWTERKRAAFHEHHTQVEAVMNYYRERGGVYMAEQVEAFHRWPEFSRQED
jgi:LmbE family N-acetylglucosaminyl deacetylase